MRILLVPELYRRPASACGTLQDATAWIEQWLGLDPHLHVYLLMPPRSQVGYAREDVHAELDRVTLLEAATLARSLDGGDPVLTDTGYAREELTALQEAIQAPGGYVDVVVDQRRAGQFTLRQWLVAVADNPWAGQLAPFELVKNVHDLQLAFKHRGCGHRDPAQGDLEILHAARADGLWFTAHVDREGFRQRAPELLDDALVDEALAAARTIASPIALDDASGTYAEEPSTLHLAGSFWAKKNVDDLLAVAQRLHDEHGIRTLVTSPDPLPEHLPAGPWLTAYGEASRSTYEEALAAGDLAVTASSYETMPRTPFEQAAHGQVLLARDVPWTRSCTPDDHPLLAPLDELAGLAVDAVDRWEAAVAANRRLVDHLRRTRSPERVGERTYSDLRGRVDRRLARFQAPDLVAHVEALLADTGLPVELPELVSVRPGSGEPSLAEREDVTRVDVVHALRRLGLVDTGRDARPMFRPARPTQPLPAPPMAERPPAEAADR